MAYAFASGTGLGLRFAESQEARNRFKKMMDDIEDDDGDVEPANRDPQEWLAWFLGKNCVYTRKMLAYITRVKAEVRNVRNGTIGEYFKSYVFEGEDREPSEY